MTHDAVAAIRQLQVLPHGDKGIGFGDQHLSQHPTSPFTCDFGQGIVDIKMVRIDRSWTVRGI
jgi:hypothetical protein